MTWNWQQEVREIDAVEQARAWTRRATCDRMVSWKLYCVWFDIYLGKALQND